MKNRFPLKIVISNDRKGYFKATTSIGKLNEGSGSIQQELSYVELDYTILVTTLRNFISIVANRKRIDPRLYWLVGDNILRFLERIDDIGFYLIQQNFTLARDIEVSDTSIKRIISFRRRFLKISMINPAISWKKYRDNKVFL